MKPAELPESLRLLIIERTEHRCEYCRTLEAFALLPFETDHVVPVKHGGLSLASNLAWSCFHCNRRKGTDIASIDPATGILAPLFNPRTMRWADHFGVLEAFILPLTPEGRVTVYLLRFNSVEALESRRDLINAGLYP